MSNKPEKKGDVRQRLRKADAKMKKRKKAVIGTLPPFMYIVTEGTVTEVRTDESGYTVTAEFDE